ncbi:MAG: hypothetical protein GY774_27485 [Planctomycetes bacterium]|nr:hypothetical protein [Planctomycetota bacterium]
MPGFEEWMANLPVNPIAWFGTMLSIIWFVRNCTKSVDADLDAGVRDDIALRLMSFNPQKAGAWVPDFVLVFDRFFGESPWRWGFFLRSALVSVISFSLCWAVLKSMGLPMDKVAEQSFLTVSLSYVTYNIVIDYVSLLETRFLLGTRMRFVWKLVVDVALTLCICWVGIWILKNTEFKPAIPQLQILNQGEPPTLVTILAAIFDPWSGEGAAFLCILLTTFTTSIWLWLHGLAELTIRILRGSVFLIQRLNIAETPLRAVGVVVNVYVSVAGVLGYCALYAYSAFWQ